jgi:hypothetical protein
MSLVYKLAADLTVVLHLGYAACIVVGQLLIVAGAIRKWQWIRNVWVRSIHLVMILIVVVEGLLGIVCPLTTLEKWLRQQAGQVSYQGDFLARWVHNLLFVECSPTTLQAIYILFGLAVAVTFWRAPPRRRQRPLDASDS